MKLMSRVVKIIAAKNIAVKIIVVFVTVSLGALSLAHAKTNATTPAVGSSATAVSSSAASSQPLNQSSAQSSSGETLKIGVNGMVCSFCAQGIEKKFKTVKSVESVDVDLDNKIVLLRYKKGEKADFEQAKAFIRDAGYEVTSVDPSKWC